MNNLVSVIIPTTNKELSLAEKSAAIVRGSSYKNIEIIIVNEGKERSEQRNLGIDRAKGEVILYLDSDQFVSPGLIEECVRLMNYGYGAIYIPEIIITPGVFAYIRNWERSFYNGTAIDCVRVFRRNGCPRFDEEQKGTEDSDWDRRIKGIKSISKNPLYHYDNVNMFKWFSKKAYYSKSMKRFIERNPDDKILDWKWRCVKVFLENSKWKRFLSRPDLALAVLGIIFVRGLIYYANR